MPKPSISELHATKSQRMAQRRTRVKAAIANLPNEPNSNLHRMSDEELDKAYLAAEESAKKRGLKQDTTNAGGGRNKNNPGGTFIRRAKQDLMDDRATLRLMEDGRMERKLWGNGGNGNPYAPAGNLVTETNYYGTFIYMYVVFVCVVLFILCALRGCKYSICSSTAVGWGRMNGCTLPKILYMLYNILITPSSHFIVHQNK